MKNRPQCKDIPDDAILQACDQFHAELKTWRLGHYVRATDNQHVAGEPMTPEERLADRWPPKLILAKMARMVDRGLLDCGVSLRTAWRVQKPECVAVPQIPRYITEGFDHDLRLCILCGDAVMAHSAQIATPWGCPCCWRLRAVPVRLSEPPAPQLPWHRVGFGAWKAPANTQEMLRIAQALAGVVEKP